jgi:hypothetical protein
MTARDTSEERTLKLRLAARALIEWKEPPTSPRYKRVVEELLAIHPFAAHVGFHLDRPFVKLDTRGVVLWYLSETLDYADAPPSPPRMKLDEKIMTRLLHYFREEQFIGSINELRDVRDEELGYDITVEVLWRYMHRIISDLGTRREQEYVNNLLVLLIGEDRRTRLDLLKGQAAAIADIIKGHKRRWGLSLYHAVLRTPFTLSLVIAALLGGVFMVTKTLSLPTWAVWAARALFFILLAESLTTRKIYYLLKNSPLELWLIRRRLYFVEEHLFSSDVSIRAYAYYLMSRCYEEEAFLPTLLRDEAGIPPEVILSLLTQYSREGVESVLGLLADPEISAQRRALIFAWLCRVIIVPKEHLIDIPLREYLERHLA